MPKRNQIRTPLVVAAVIALVLILVLAAAVDIDYSENDIIRFIVAALDPGNYNEAAPADEIADTGASLQDTAAEASHSAETVVLEAGDEVADAGADLGDTISEDSPVEAVGDEEDAGPTALEDCLAPPESYLVTWDDYVEENTDTSALCKATFTLTNLSGDRLAFKQHLVDDGYGNRRDNWLERRLSPGEQFAVGGIYKSVSVLVDGTTQSVGTFTEMIVVWSTPACVALIGDDDLAAWEGHTVPLHDPCTGAAD